MKKLISTVFFTLFGLSLMAQTPVNLKLNLEKGEVFTIKSSSIQIIQQTPNGQHFVTEVQTNTFVSCKVLKQENEVIDLELKYDTIASKIISPMYNRETNSTKTVGNEPIEDVLNKMSTYKLIAKISTTGKFIEFVNYGKYRDSVMFVLDAIPATKRDEARKQAEGLLKESAIKSMVEPLFSYLPDKAVKANDTWETSYFTTTANLSLLMLNNYTLKGVENDLAIVSGTSAMESLPSNDPTAKMTQELKGTSTMEGTIDLKSGLTSRSKSKGFFEGMTTMKNNGEEMKIPMMVNAETEIIMTKQK